MAPVNIDLIKNNLRKTMWNNVGIYRNQETLSQAKTDIENYQKDFGRNDKCLNIEEYELRNMLIASRLITESALKRKESLGANYRTDYPDKNPKPEHTVISI